MFKKIVPALALVLSLALLAVSAPAQAQLFADEEEAKQAFAKEKPLTQADIDLFIKMAPRVFATENPNEGAKFFKEAGLTDTRGAYIMTKVSLAMMQIEGESNSANIMAGVPEPMRPTKAEMELVTKNRAALDKVVNSEGESGS